MRTCSTRTGVMVRRIGAVAAWLAAAYFGLGGLFFIVVNIRMFAVGGPAAPAVVLDFVLLAFAYGFGRLGLHLWRLSVPADSN